MKKHINLWLVMFLAISLALPIYSMAQTTLPMLTLEDSSGNRIGGANVKTFSLGPDNNLVVHLDRPFNFVALLPDISLSSCTSCTITGPASVTASPSANLSFNVQSSDTNAAISLVVHPEAGTSLPPPSSPGTPLTFSWNTGGNPAMPPGSYLAVFQATDGVHTSQIVVMIKIAQQYKLTLTAGANGSVTPAGVAYYDPATQVQISATANQSYYFSGWSGDVQGTTNPLTITMNSDKTITANFTQTPTQYTLATSISPANAGTVSPSSGNYDPNTNVNLTATANSGYTFSSWSGLASGDTSSGNTARIYMNNNRSITANFVQPSPTPSGTPWVWGDYPRFGLDAGQQQVYIVNIPAQTYRYLKAGISGGTMSTMGTFSWTFPDGTVYPQNSSQGTVSIMGMNGAGLLVLRAGSNIPDPYIPGGNHVFIIKATTSSYFGIFINVE
ncbi:MAG: hypothetical protein ABSB32_18340 [Thermodesulfobacteriota bacterium]